MYRNERESFVGITLLYEVISTEPVILLLQKVIIEIIQFRIKLCVRNFC